MQEPVEGADAVLHAHEGDRLRARSATSMELHTNSSNNTVFADADGQHRLLPLELHPAARHRFDWTRPVDGSDPATEWNGVHSIDESPNVLNPPNGWIQNTNNWPFSAAGPTARSKADYPPYMETGRENPRGIHAVRVLADGRTSRWSR